MPLAVCLFFSACSSSEQGDGETGDPALVSALVQDVADATGRESMFRNLFADGAVPEKNARSKYRKYSFRAIEPAVFDGDTATVKVVATNLKDEPVGEITWTAVKEGERWKLRDAPLPISP